MVIVLLGGVFLSGNLYGAKGDTKKKGFVLKFNGFNLKSYNNFTLSSKAGLIRKGSSFLTPQKNSGTEVNSIITFEKGNTTFIYPYKHKVKVSVPLFKTPMPPSQQ